MTIKHDPTKLLRHELLMALAGLVEPSDYQALCDEPTAMLRGLLLALQCPEDEKIAPEKPKMPGKEAPNTFCGFEIIVEKRLSNGAVYFEMPPKSPRLEAWMRFGRK